MNDTTKFVAYFSFLVSKETNKVLVFFATIIFFSQTDMLQPVWIVLFIRTVYGVSPGWNTIASTTTVGIRAGHCFVYVPSGADMGMYVMGGTTTGSNYLNDVWRSTVAPYSTYGASAYQSSASWSTRSQMRCLVLATTTPPTIVLSGGYAGGTTGYNQVWSSNNGGLVWSSTTSNAPWSARDWHGFIYDPGVNQMFIMAGLLRTCVSAYG
jgi:hypothetical protein